MKTSNQGKLMLWNNNRISSSLILNNYNNRLSSSSSPISKRHRKMMTMMDDDSIGKVRRTTMTTICDLPEEALTQVLVKLSVKDILTCVCVRKSWHSLIKTHKFITLHSNYQKIRSNKYLLFRNTDTRTYEIRLDNIQCKLYLTLKYPPPYLPDQCFDFRLVSNGLICLSSVTVRQDIYLWNPVIQKYITLPRSPQRPSSCERTLWKGIAFGFVPEINDYVVVYMAKYSLKNKPRTHSIIACVYNLSTNSWKQITHHNTRMGYICLSESVIVNGIAVWIGYNSHMDRILLCFDTKTGVLREILSPKTRSSLPVIRAFDQSIVYFVVKGKAFDEHDMWILKGDLMNEFVWEKKMMIREEAFVHVLGLRNNGEPILGNSSDLISYNLDTHKSYDFVKSWNSWKPFGSGNDRLGDFYSCKDRAVGLPFIIKPFAESLDLLDIDSTKCFARSHVN